MSSRRPLILAHRGASAYAPENTLAAFLLARELGADGVELDVQLSRDGVPVVIHDHTVERTTNGYGRVSELTIWELKQLDAGAWKDAAFSGEKIPTLAEVFDVLADWLRPARRTPQGLINVELKTERLKSDGLERAVINLINKYNLGDRILLSSFNPLALYRAKKQSPNLKRGLLYEQTMPLPLRRAWLRFWVNPQAMHPEHTMIDARYMAWARRKRLEVNTWTVDDPLEARRLADLGVNAIITNTPDVIRVALEM